MNSFDVDVAEMCAADLSISIYIDTAHLAGSEPPDEENAHVGASGEWKLTGELTGAMWRLEQVSCGSSQLTETSRDHGGLNRNSTIREEISERGSTGEEPGRAPWRSQPTGAAMAPTWGHV